MGSSLLTGIWFPGKGVRTRRASDGARGRRIVDLALRDAVAECVSSDHTTQILRKVTAAHRSSWNSDVVDRLRSRVCFLEIGKKEASISTVVHVRNQYRTATRRSELVLSKNWFRSASKARRNFVC